MNKTTRHKLNYKRYMERQERRYNNPNKPSWAKDTDAHMNAISDEINNTNKSIMYGRPL